MRCIEFNVIWNKEIGFSIKTIDIFRFPPRINDSFTQILYHQKQLVRCNLFLDNNN